MIFIEWLFFPERTAKKQKLSISIYCGLTNMTLRAKIECLSGFDWLLWVLARSIFNSSTGSTHQMDNWE